MAHTGIYGLMALCKIGVWLFKLASKVVTGHGSMVYTCYGSKIDYRHKKA